MSTALTDAPSWTWDYWDWDPGCVELARESDPSCLIPGSCPGHEISLTRADLVAMLAAIEAPQVTSQEGQSDAR